ncbi:ammonium transporter [Pseudomonas profundi]|uniref:ammonium transporter n=1 Tax=Pseudomonas profundi TaxID=1981513 RepID=UPI00123C1339|nr:ammonium transporter [Pseudomonas profundi]
MSFETIDVLWIVLCAGLVFNMQLGFLCLESGLTRSKNAINVAVKNMADLSVAIVLYWLFGFGLMFGSSANGWFGTGFFMVSFDDTWRAAFFLFQAMFCTTAATIVSGAAAERMRFSGYLVVTVIAAGLIYPLYGHWAWAGAFSESVGWLAARGFTDFAGSTVVHSVGGWIALAVILVLGPRRGRFELDREGRSLPGSNLPVAMLGGLLLMFGWFGFNGGSTFRFDTIVPGIIANTVLAGVVGILGGMLASWLRWRHVDPVYPLNGLIAGMVSITASAHVVSAGSAVMIGFTGSLVMYGADRLMYRWRIDDAVSAVPVHLASGIWGTLAVALFADLELLNTGLSRWEQLMVQFEGIMVAGLWAFGVTWILLQTISRWLPMRVSTEAEMVGLNVSEHGARTELIELLDAMEAHQHDGRFEQEVLVEPFTEVGQIAAQYNKVIRALRSAVGMTQAIVRDIRDGVVTCSAEGLLTTCNPGAERLFGRGASDLIGQPIRGLVAEQGWGGLPLPEAGNELKQEVLFTRHDQSFVAELTVSRGALDDPFYTCMIRDITERRRVEQQLFQEKTLAQVTLASIGDGVITTGPDGRVRYLNPVAEKLTGWSAEQASDRPLEEVYQLFDEQTDAPLGNPVTALLRRHRRALVGQGEIISLLRKRDGEQVYIQDAVAPMHDQEGRIIGAVLTFRDVTSTRRMANELSHQAAHDALTGLANRSEFERRLAMAVQAHQESDRKQVLCYMDLDQFKIVNDTCGHAAGDELLRQLARLFQTRIRSSDVLARLGGDEFGLLLVGCSLEEAIPVADDIRSLIEDFRFSWENRTFAIGVSIGLVLIGEQMHSLGELLSAADSACYAAKDAGRNRIHIYQADDQILIERRGEMLWVNRIREAVDRDLLRLYVQPIIPVHAEPGGPRYEVLVRMLGDDGRIIPPGAFMPAAERYDLATAIDRWVVGNFLAWVGDYQRRSKGPLGHYSINLAAASLGEDGFLEFVLDTIKRHQIPASCICFEITETSAIANLSRAVIFMQRLKTIGCHFALDDFGSGLSSFAYLKTLPVDILKIDGVFVKDIETDPIAAAMVSSINTIGHEMGLKTVAEYVENEAILERLRELGVDYAQGYLLGHPRPLSELDGVRMMPR